MWCLCRLRAMSRCSGEMNRTSASPFLRPCGLRHNATPPLWKRTKAELDYTVNCLFLLPIHNWEDEDRRIDDIRGGYGTWVSFTLLFFQYKRLTSFPSRRSPSYQIKSNPATFGANRWSWSDTLYHPDLPGNDCHARGGRATPNVYKTCALTRRNVPSPSFVDTRTARTTPLPNNTPQHKCLPPQPLRSPSITFSPLVVPLSCNKILLPASLLRPLLPHAFPVTTLNYVYLPHIPATANHNVHQMLRIYFFNSFKDLPSYNSVQFHGSSLWWHKMTVLFVSVYSCRFFSCLAYDVSQMLYLPEISIEGSERMCVRLD